MQQQTPALSILKSMAPRQAASFSHNLDWEWAGEYTLSRNGRHVFQADLQVNLSTCAMYVVTLTVLLLIFYKLQSR